MQPFPRVRASSVQDFCILFYIVYVIWFDNSIANNSIPKLQDNDKNFKYLILKDKEEKNEKIIMFA